MVLLSQIQSARLVQQRFLQGAARQVATMLRLHSMHSSRSEHSSLPLLPPGHMHGVCLAQETMHLLARHATLPVFQYMCRSVYALCCDPASWVLSASRRQYPGHMHPPRLTSNFYSPVLTRSSQHAIRYRPHAFSVLRR